VKRFYEIALIIRPDLGEEGYVEKLAQLKNIFTEQGVRIVGEDNWGLRKMAYTIKKHKEAFYCFLAAEMEPDTVKLINYDAEMDEDVLRIMVRLQKPIPGKEEDAAAESEGDTTDQVQEPEPEDATDGQPE